MKWLEFVALVNQSLKDKGEENPEIWFIEFLSWKENQVPIVTVHSGHPKTSGLRVRN